MNDWSNLKDGELLLAYASLMEELRARGIVRSSNNPVGDFTEFLVARALGLNLLGQSAAGHDATDASGVRYQNKGRRPTEHNKSVQLGIMRNLELRPFDVLAAVIYSSTFSVSYAALIPIEVVSEFGSFSTHSNGQVFHFRRSLLNDPRVTDITVKISATQQGAPAEVLAPASLPARTRLSLGVERQQSGSSKGCEQSSPDIQAPTPRQQQATTMGAG